MDNRDPLAPKIKDLSAFLDIFKHKVERRRQVYETVFNMSQTGES